jgi:hypothetical protein
MTHIDDELLVDLALGDPADDLTAAHLASCAECRDSLDAISHTVAVTRSTDAELLVPAPPSVWAAIESTLDADEAAASTPGTAPDPGPADALAIRRGRARRGRSLPGSGWLAAAAVAGIALGSAGTALITSATEPGPTPTPTVAMVAEAHLDTLDTKKDLGTAEVVRSASAISLSVTTHDLKADGGYLEVWLINRDGERMVSVGVLPGTGTMTFPISQALIDRGYVIVDISREAYDKNPAHSGDSLVRGTLKA